jgi:hypothetical protein
MQIKPTSPKSPEEQALLHELAVSGSSDRAKLLAFLCEQAPPPAGDVPPLPEDLRQRLEEKFGAKLEPKRQTRPTQEVGMLHSLIAWVKETFSARPMAFGGGFAVAACVVLLAILNFGPQTQPGTTPGDTIRSGGGNDTVAPVSGVSWYWIGTGTAEAALQNQLLPVAGGAFQQVASLEELPTVQGSASAIAVDPQFGAWLKKSSGDPQPFLAEGVPGSAEWPASLTKACEAAASAAKN